MAMTFGVVMVTGAWVPAPDRDEGRLFAGMTGGGGDDGEVGVGM